jgi:hypothetical protein
MPAQLGRKCGCCGKRQLGAELRNFPVRSRLQLLEHQAKTTNYLKSENRIGFTGKVDIRSLFTENKDEYRQSATAKIGLA